MDEKDQSGHIAGPGAPMGPTQWDDRYRASGLVWGAGANRWVEQETADLAPGRALDLACGEGRNALWLAERGWRVTGVDFSPVAICKAVQTEAASGPRPAPVAWMCADATTFRADGQFDLVLIIYLHVPPLERRAALAGAVAALAPGGVLLVIGHDASNIEHGTGGPQNPDVLYTAADLAFDLAALDRTLVVDSAVSVHREVTGADRPAIDALLRAHRP